MIRKWYCLLALALLPVIPAWPDTVKIKNNLSVNGTIATMSDSVLMIEAEFSSGAKATLGIAMKDVQSIDFNSIIRNGGPPPKVMGFGPSQGVSPATKQETGIDMIILRGGVSGKNCKLVRIDSARVHCDPGDSQYARSTVLRILVAPK